MLTPSELRNAQFSKARLGGYVMAEVDKLLDQVTPDYETLYNENAELRKKVEVLLDRLDHYQEQEDSIKAAILNAQRMCDTIVAQAKQQAALIEQDAKIKASRVAEEAQRSIQDKNDELAAIRQEVTQFRSSLVALYRSHLEKIREIPTFVEETLAQEQPASESAPACEPTSESVTAATQPAPDHAPTSEGALQETEHSATAPLPQSEEAQDPPQTEPVFAAQPAAFAATQPPLTSAPQAPKIESDFDKTMEFTPPRPSDPARTAAEADKSAAQQDSPAAHEGDAAYAASMVVEILDDDVPIPYLQDEPLLDEEEIDYSGIHSLNLEDSLEFGSEFDIATGKRR